MTTQVRVPTLPESVSDATVLTWHKQPGDAIARDENLVDLETDKVVLEVPSPIDGIMGKQMVTDGAVVKANDLLGEIEPGAAKGASAGKTAAKAEHADVAQTTGASGEEDPVLTPAVRRLVKELAIDPLELSGSGKDGRILKSDVMDYLDQKAGGKDPDIAAAEPSATIPPASAAGDRTEQRVPMTRLRTRIAERLKEAQDTAAILTTFNEVDLKNVAALRRQFKDQFEASHGVKLGYMSFFVKAAIEALKKFPVVNASVDGTDIVYHGFYDIGIAVGSPRGLVVPILRNADRLSFAEIEEAVKAFGQKAQEGALTFEDLNGGTFTISNGGVYGSMLSTPILNPPQSGILGMHNIVERPVAVRGQVEVRPMMYLALSYDHRIIDGREAVQFLVTIKQCLEDPARLLLQL
jgi:2-oxoglutarate dehydrogenase E2 component (dihydrolipoamide succinyltransferase)